jgi:hypothetical protein
MFGEQQVARAASAQELGGIQADVKEKEAMMAQQRLRAQTELDSKTDTMFRQYSEQWSNLQRTRQESFMELMTTVNNLRNQEEATKLEIEAKKRNLQDENTFNTALASAKFAEFLNIAKTDARVKNAIYSGQARDIEALARMSNGDAFMAALETLKLERMQASYKNMEKGIKTNTSAYIASKKKP